MLPLKIDEISVNADVVAAGPAPSPCIMLWPTGIPSIITTLEHHLYLQHENFF